MSRAIVAPRQYTLGRERTGGAEGGGGRARELGQGARSFFFRPRYAAAEGGGMGKGCRKGEGRKGEGGGRRAHA